MGFLGMGAYLTLLLTMYLRGRRVQRMLVRSWPEVSDIGWTFKMQAVTIAVGGFFSPLPWNPVTLILAASASSLLAAVRSEVRQPASLMVPAAVPAG
ncbi:MAG TPA: hypothetical protein EYP62_00860 [Kiritimatiellae bacterium]|nr:hypothetical protein [Kiritimatiellia bacterium]